MKKNCMFRHVLLFLVCLCLLPLVCACNTKEPAAPPFQICGEGAPTYTLVRGDTADDAEVEAMLLLKKYLRSCGVDMEVTTDWEKNPVSEYEIVIGDTLRTETEPAPTLDVHELGAQGWYVSAVGTRIYLCGGSPAATMDAVVHFITEFFGYKGDAETGTPAGIVTIPGDYLYTEKESFLYRDITCMDVSLRDFRIVVADTFSTSTKAVAETVQARFYEDFGIWMEIDTKNEGSGPALRLYQNIAETRGSFSLAADASTGDLLLTMNAGTAFELGWANFKKALSANAASEDAVYAMDADYSYRDDIGDVVYYSAFGAVGDGKTDDLAAIAATHKFANEYNLPVRADAGATYYIASWDVTAEIKTDTDWTDASFILDDREVPLDKRSTFVFDVVPSKESYAAADFFTESDANGFVLCAGQENVGFTLDEKTLFLLVDNTTKRYIREGMNANDGSDQQEVILVDTDGTIDPLAPVIWDYKQVTRVKALPVDAETLTIRGGTFTTIVADNITDPTYYNRGIRVRRSNVVVDGITHYVENETEEIGAPYSGILVITECAYVTVKNCLFTPHHTFYYVKPDGTDFSQGTYDINPHANLHLTFENCSQSIDIKDAKYWGVIGSNFCKNLKVDGCSFSRVDAHQGGANMTILNSELGHQGLSVIGFGTLYLENTTLYGYSMINLRSDYGSMWKGDLIVKDCTWIPNCGEQFSLGATIIGGSYTGYHDFGYECYMPTNIIIDGLMIYDSQCYHSGGMFILANFTPDYVNAAFEADVEKNGYPLHMPETITLKNIQTERGLKLRLSDNKFMFRNVTVIEE